MSKTKLVTLLLALMTSPAFGQAQHWTIKSETAPMTDQKLTLIMTPAEGFTKEDAEGVALAITCTNNKVEVAVFANAPNYMPAVTGRIDEGVISHWVGYSTTNVHMRFDSNKATGAYEWVLVEPRIMQAWQGIGMSSKGLVKKLMAVNRFMVQYTASTGATQVATFYVSGLEEAIRQVSDCKVK
ncbi:MAG TPA: hypothetical protein VII95_00365 [Terriglobales bacterium]|jgi:hypothetical protein